jgi:uncharacterized protein
MVPSRYNQVTKIDDSNYAVYNVLSGAFDIAGPDDYEAFKVGSPRGDEEREYWFSRGYFFDSREDEEKYIDERYQDYLVETNGTEMQILLVPGYACNFNCSYCYQRGVDTDYKMMSEEAIRAFVTFVTGYAERYDKQVYVTLFGGEPLLDGKTHRSRIELLVNMLAEKEIPLAVVTNGYNLESYLDILEKAEIREIHLTLDGDKPVHDERRSPLDGSGSFDRIIDGMQAALKKGIPVNIRIIIDRITMPTLPSLADRLDTSGLLDQPVNLLKSSLGRNYELINEYPDQSILYSMDEMYRDYTDLIIKHPVVAKLHTPAYFGITNLVNSGEMYIPNFDSCPAGKSELVCDFDGKIYGCTASCGRDGYELGTFYPAVKLDFDQIKPWRERSIKTIGECMDCSVGVLCGGGCGVIANEQNGSVMSPNCKPVKAILDQGIRYYSKQLLNADSVLDESII